MNDIAIRVENLSKRYHIGRARERHDTPSALLRTRLRDALADFGLRILDFGRKSPKSPIQNPNHRVDHGLGRVPRGEWAEARVEIADECALL